VASIVAEAWERVTRGFLLPSAKRVPRWLRDLAHDRCVDHVRSGLRRKRVPVVAFSACLLVSRAEESATESVSRLLGLVPRKRWRRALELRYVEEWDYPRIARKLRVAVPTARSWVHRGLVHLRKALTERPDLLP